MAKEALSEEDKLRRNQKHLAFTWDEIRSEIDANRGTFDKRALVRGSAKSVRVIVRVKAPSVRKWAMAIVVEPHGRIDGIDWESRVDDHRGKAHNCSGWHRHMWKATTLDVLKECLQNFAPKSIKEFIFTGFKILNVQVKGGPLDASGRLPFD